MGGEGALAVVLEHLLGIAVVGGDQGDTAHLGGGLHHLAHALVHGLHSLDGGLKDAGVAHHVAVGEVQDDDVVLAALDALHALVADLVGAHLGLQVVGSHLGGGDQAPVLAGEGLLHAAVEEEGDMGILLGLGDPELGQAVLRDILTENVMQGLLGEGHLHVGHGGVIGGGAHEVDREEALLPLEAVEIRVHQGAGDLPGPVGPEVHEDAGVALADMGVLGADHRDDELVGDAGVIALLDRVHRVGVKLGALAVDHGGIGLLHPVPVGVPVHGVVTAGHRGDGGAVLLAHLLHLGHIALAGGGGHVPAVQEAVDIDGVAAQLAGHLDGGLHVLDMGVDAAVAEQTHDMHGLARVPGGGHGLQIGGILKEVPVGDGLGDFGQVLEHHPAGADVGVAHLAVAHLALGQTHVQAGGGEVGAGVFGKELVQHRGVGGVDRVALVTGAEAEAIHNNKNGWGFHENQILRS